MSQAIRATVGLVIISASIISVSYLTSKGRDNEKEYLKSSEVMALKEELRAKDQRIDSLEQQNRQYIAEKKGLDENLKQALRYINDKSTFDLPGLYKKCLDSSITTKPSTLSDQDYLRYSNALTTRVPAARTYLAEQLPGYQKRYVQVVSVENQIVNITVHEANVTSIYPECKVSNTPNSNYRYDIARNTVTAVGQ
jgi:hypothetical protein